MKTLNDDDIDDAANSLDIKIPDYYRQLLTSVGHGTKDHIEIYHPSEITGLYEFHFEEPDDLFKKWFPIGCNNETQELWIIDVGTGKIACVYHETHPDDYQDEEWIDYENWSLPL